VEECHESVLIPLLPDKSKTGRVINWEIQLARPLRTHRCGLPAIVRTLGEAVDLIDEDLPETLRFRPAWREVKEMLVTAAETRTDRTVENGTRLLERVLDDEGWLD
jgi:hypothetical protein